MTDTAAYALSALGTAAALVVLPYLFARAADKIADFHERGMQRVAVYDARGRR